MSAVEAAPVPGPVTGRRVLFVDDEPHILAALRRMLRSERERWEMLFATSGVEALEVMDQEPVDAIVSDMRMPGMNGAELLAQVQRRTPATARIILSGQADLESVLSVLRSAQQFLAKPCDVATLTGAVNQALRVQQMITDPTLRQIIGRVVSLPSLPTVYHDLVAAMDSPDVDLSALAQILSSDVATSAELLKLVNSAFFGLPRAIDSVNSAVSLLGLDTIQALVLTGSVFRGGKSPAQIADVKRLQESALRRAAIARVISAREGWPTHERNLAVLSCMLRDVGGLVLAEDMPAAAARLSQQAAAGAGTGPADQAAREQEAYGCTVPQASAYLLGLWGFAPAVVHTVAGQPLVAPAPSTTHFEYALHFADLRILDPLQHVVEEPNGYLTPVRMRDWNVAADEVIAR